MTAAEVEARLEPKGANLTYGSLKAVGVAATTVDDRLTQNRVAHTAILYRRKKEKGVRVFEMQGHKLVRDVPVETINQEALATNRTPPSYVWIEPKASEMRLRLVVERARLVASCHKEHAVPYGFEWKTSTFDTNGGLRLGPNEIGFTCSTIVTAIFEAENVKLVDPSAWPAPDSDDLKARENFLTHLRRKDAEHAKTLARDINAPRIAPEEVVAAAALHPTVGTFENVREGAYVVRGRIGL